jgi:ADP-ribosylation factor-like protein 3
LGLDNAGKTTILKAMSRENPSSVAPTRGFNVKQIVKDNVEFNIWDIGGQKPLRAFWSGYYDKVNGVVWVIDSADSHRLVETGYELAALLQEERLAGVPLLILANKQDLATAKPPDQVCFDF